MMRCIACKPDIQNMLKKNLKYFARCNRLKVDISRSKQSITAFLHTCKLQTVEALSSYPNILRAYIEIVDIIYKTYKVYTAL